MNRTDATRNAVLATFETAYAELGAKVRQTNAPAGLADCFEIVADAVRARIHNDANPYNWQGADVKFFRQLLSAEIASHFGK